MKRFLTLAACAVVFGSFAGCGGDVGQKIEKAGAAAKEKAGDAVTQAKEKAGEAAETVKEKTGEAAEAVKEKAGEVAEAAKELTVGGVNLGTEFTALVDKLKTVLGDIKDSETATKAEEELKAADTTLDGLLAKAKELPEAARPALHAIAKKGIEVLKPLIDKVLAIDGLGETIKPKLEALLARLKTAAGEK